MFPAHVFFALTMVTSLQADEIQSPMAQTAADTAPPSGDKIVQTYEKAPEPEEAFGAVGGAPGTLRSNEVMSWVSGLPRYQELRKQDTVLIAEDPVVIRETPEAVAPAGGKTL